MQERFDNQQHSPRRRRIVVPLDGSDLAERALSYAIALPARALRLIAVAPIDLTAARERWAKGSPSPWGTWAVDDPKAYLELMGTPFREQGWMVEPLVLDGKEPGPRIVDGAAGSDLIVMATRGQGMTRALVGSTAEYIVRHSDTPTMLVRDEYPAEAVLRIVVPLDGSAGAEEAIPLAIALQRTLRADLQLVEVVDPSTSIRTVDELRREAGIYLDIQATALRKVSGAISRDVRIGDPVEQLLADLRPGDVVVMASHGAGGIRRLLLGSVAAAMVDRAPVPVTLVRAMPGEMGQRFAAELMLRGVHETGEPSGEAADPA